MWDEFGAQHALLRGSPERLFDGVMNSNVLRLDGNSQYVVLDRSLCDMLAGSFGMWCKPNDADTNKPLLFMGSSAGKYLKLVARDSSGNAALTITDGSTTADSCFNFYCPNRKLDTHCGNPQRQPGITVC